MKCWRSIPASGFTIRRPATPTAPGARRSPNAIIPGESHQRHRQTHPGPVSRAEQPRHQQRPAEQPVRRAVAQGDSRQLRRQGQLEPQHRAPDLGQGVDDGRVGAGPVLPAVEPAGGGDTTVSLWTVGQTWTLEPDAAVRRQRRIEQDDPPVAGPDFGTNFGLDVFGIPGLNSAGVTGPGSADLQRYSGMPLINTGLSTLGNNCRLDTRCGATRSATPPRPT